MNTIGINGIFNLKVVRDEKVIAEVKEHNKILDSMQALLLRQLTSNLPFSIDGICLFSSSAQDLTEGFTATKYPFKSRSISSSDTAVYKWEITGEQLLKNHALTNGNLVEATVKDFALVATTYDGNGSISSVSNLNNLNIDDSVAVAQKSIKESITITNSDKLVGEWQISFSLNTNA